MSNRIVSIRSSLIMLLAMTLTAGCSDTAKPTADYGKGSDVRSEWNGREREGMDSGVGALAFVADGTLLARTTPGGMLWKIDVARSRATMSGAVKQLPADPCAIASSSMTTQFLNDFERG